MRSTVELQPMKRRDTAAQGQSRGVRGLPAEREDRGFLERHLRGAGDARASSVGGVDRQHLDLARFDLVPCSRQSDDKRRDLPLIDCFVTLIEGGQPVPPTSRSTDGSLSGSPSRGSVGTIPSELISVAPAAAGLMRAHSRRTREHAIGEKPGGTDTASMPTRRPAHYRSPLSDRFAGASPPRERSRAQTSA